MHVCPEKIFKCAFFKYPASRFMYRLINKSLVNLLSEFNLTKVSGSLIDPRVISFLNMIRVLWPVHIGCMACRHE